ncbi:cell envelope integrity protein TolA [Vibrio fluvialis]|uniref:cell envelope integrity protein TolA n=1 Tax=Vibrio fluvialis TaxID=676 RepID=UPI001C9DEE4D|nr:cell envelope integrity protein TolA [Vibrio fluvialis]MBY7816198.1 cell envelope integrity protein TolA [Vibrio fluvialis]
MLRWMLAISILCTWVVHASEAIAEQQKEQKQAIERIFSQMDVTSEVQRWGAIYTQLIRQNLPDQSQYKDEVCRVNIRLHPSGSVRRVAILPPPPNKKSTNQELLCNDVFLTVYRLKRFPMPKQVNLKERLQNINLTVTP